MMVLEIICMDTAIGEDNGCITTTPAGFNLTAMFHSDTNPMRPEDISETSCTELNIKEEILRESLKMLLENGRKQWDKLLWNTEVLSKMFQIVSEEILRESLKMLLENGRKQW